MPAIPTLETESLILRPLREEDALAIARILSTPRQVGRAPSLRHHYPVEAALSWIRQHNAWAEQGIHLQWAIGRPAGDLVGVVSLDLGTNPPEADVGYLIERDHWNKGYATEAVRAVIEWTFTSLDVPRINATCFAVNVASTRVLEKCGFTPEATIPAYLDSSGTRQDIIRYGITREIDET